MINNQRKSTCTEYLVLKFNFYDRKPHVNPTKLRNESFPPSFIKKIIGTIETCGSFYSLKLAHNSLLID